MHKPQSTIEDPDVCILHIFFTNNQIAELDSLQSIHTVLLIICRHKCVKFGINWYIKKKTRQSVKTNNQINKVAMLMKMMQSSM